MQCIWPCLPLLLSLLRGFPGWKPFPAEFVINPTNVLQGMTNFGHAVGPQWARALPQSKSASHITFEYGTEVAAIQSNSPQHSATQQSTGVQTAICQTTMQSTPNAEDIANSAGGDQGGAWPVTVYLSNGKQYCADLVISAIGVQPNTDWLPEEISRDTEAGGVIVDRYALP